MTQISADSEIRRTICEHLLQSADKMLRVGANWQAWEIDELFCAGQAGGSLTSYLAIEPADDVGQSGF